MSLRQLISAPAGSRWELRRAGQG